MRDTPAVGRWAPGPDPRAELRWGDGSAWTAPVSSGGAGRTDGRTDGVPIGPGDPSSVPRPGEPVARAQRPWPVRALRVVALAVAVNLLFDLSAQMRATWGGDDGEPLTVMVNALSGHLTITALLSLFVVGLYLAYQPTWAPPADRVRPVARWAPDPYLSFPWRWFDGSAWTAHVAVGGRIGSDDASARPAAVAPGAVGDDPSWDPAFPHYHGHTRRYPPDVQRTWALRRYVAMVFGKWVVVTLLSLSAWSATYVLLGGGVRGQDPGPVVFLASIAVLFAVASAMGIVATVTMRRHFNERLVAELVPSSTPMRSPGAPGVMHLYRAQRSKSQTWLPLTIAVRNGTVTVTVEGATIAEGPLGTFKIRPVRWGRARLLHAGGSLLLSPVPAADYGRRGAVLLGAALVEDLRSWLRA